MAVVRRRGTKFELRVKHRLLPRVFTVTFADEVAARNYGEQLEAMLSRGVLPVELAAPCSRGLSDTLAKLIHGYRRAVAISALDEEVLGLLMPQIGASRFDEVIKY
jgi:hypothetical protein